VAEIESDDHGFGAPVGAVWSMIILRCAGRSGADSSNMFKIIVKQPARKHRRVSLLP
jgi:hypothetical protein